jgi:hypothetical protein
MVWQAEAKAGTGGEDDVEVLVPGGHGRDRHMVGVWVV